MRNKRTGKNNIKVNLKQDMRLEIVLMWLMIELYGGHL